MAGAPSRSCHVESSHQLTPSRRRCRAAARHLQIRGLQPGGLLRGQLRRRRGQPAVPGQLDGVVPQPARVAHLARVHGPGRGRGQRRRRRRAAPRRRGRACDLFTYGSPRVGNGEFAEFASRTGRGTTARVINAMDIVAAQPPAIFGYANISPEFWFQKGIGRAPFPDNLRVCRGTSVFECSGQFGLSDLASSTHIKVGLQDHQVLAYSNSTTTCSPEE
ncbi:hypothetical protein HIM_08374 [Hirsutella minnesotensis 3608]|uniref:Fungal lipase-type domain-containing protein n=1 Tax=Hirsutella minnesotensis 3608 TaxID=1043627 RepID=A0A0F7ZYC5_9HYPO|nr:hypothetical protein HIM_08374 [Hirsutella minnesotensis 3608]